MEVLSLSKLSTLIKISFGLFIACVLSWQLGNYFSASGKMDRATSFAIMGFVGAVFFLFSTMILSILAFVFKTKTR
jgi:hypothetical protein